MRPRKHIAVNWFKMSRVVIAISNMQHTHGLMYPLIIDIICGDNAR